MDTRRIDHASPPIPTLTEGAPFEGPDFPLIFGD
jgi:hypothetical protein